MMIFLNDIPMKVYLRDMFKRVVWLCVFRVLGITSSTFERSSVPVFVLVFVQCAQKCWSDNLNLVVFEIFRIIFGQKVEIFIPALLARGAIFLLGNFKNFDF